jgi:hypothetical protein
VEGVGTSESSEGEGRRNLLPIYDLWEVKTMNSVFISSSSSSPMSLCTPALLRLLRELLAHAFLTFHCLRSTNTTLCTNTCALNAFVWKQMTVWVWGWIRAQGNLIVQPILKRVTVRDVCVRVCVHVGEQRSFSSRRCPPTAETPGERVCFRLSNGKDM